jgi:hypothetical protein
LLMFVASMAFAWAVTEAVVPWLGIIAKWIIVGRHRAGLYPMWGVYHTRWWLTQKIVQVCGPVILPLPCRNASTSKAPANTSTRGSSERPTQPSASTTVSGCIHRQPGEAARRCARRMGPPRHPVWRYAREEVCLQTVRRREEHLHVPRSYCGRPQRFDQPGLRGFTWHSCPTGDVHRAELFHLGT